MERKGAGGGTQSLPTSQKLAVEEATILEGGMGGYRFSDADNSSKKLYDLEDDMRKMQELEEI